ncbi:protein FAM193A-like isoform X2 [Argonauta hians]
MSSVDKKSKRRKNKKNVTVKNVVDFNHVSNNLTVTTTTSTCTTTSSTPPPISSGCTTPASVSSTSDVIFQQQIQPTQTPNDSICEIQKENWTLPVLLSNRGLNSYMDKDKCLFCSCEKQASLPNADWMKSDSEKITKPQEAINHSSKYINSKSLPVLKEMNSSSNNDSSPNGLICSCVTCLERRQKEENGMEAVDFQKSWSEMRKVVENHYSEAFKNQNSKNISSENSTLYDIQVKENIHRLYTHQLFMWLESQTKECVIKKEKLLEQLDIEYRCPNEARDFVFRLFDEYRQLCQAASKVSDILTELKKDHWKKFDVTWDFYNRHLFHSIVYTNPSIQDNWPAVLKQLNSAVTTDVNGIESDPCLSERSSKFGDDMEKVSLMWKCQQKLIASYNDEQSLKMRHKILEDWEFCKKLRKLLEKSVSENAESSGSCLCHETSDHVNICCQLQSDKCESAVSHQHLGFLNDSNYCVTDVSAASISSTTTSSSCSSSPVIDLDNLPISIDECSHPLENGDAENDDSLSDVEEDEVIDEEDGEHHKGTNLGLDNANTIAQMANGILDISIFSWEDDKKQNGSALDGTAENCDYHHYITTNSENLMKSDDNQCQCHFCLRQRGNTVSTSLPQHVPILPRPAHLHLYPHIHGPSGLHGLHGSAAAAAAAAAAVNSSNAGCSSNSNNNANNSNINNNNNSNNATGNMSIVNGGLSSHARAILQPQWDVEVVQLRQQPKFIISPQSKLPVQLVRSNATALTDHEHTYQGDWENTQLYPRLLLDTQKYDESINGELLPCSSSLVRSSSSSSSSSPSSSSSDSGLPSQGAVIETLPPNHLSSSLESSSIEVQVTVQQTELLQPQESSQQSSLSFTSATPSSTSPSATTLVCSKVHKCNNQNSSIKSHSCNRPATLGGNSSSHNEKVHNQHCKKYGTKTAGAEISPRNPNIAKEELPHQPRNYTSAMLGQYSCTHSNSNNSNNNNIHNSNGHAYQNSGAIDSSLCVNAVPMPTTLNNVNVGTSTMCTDPDCVVHQEDNDDSVDDSCSEQSSSTSTSNQKEGKYCDCCYCEFLGHGTPPKAPTSHKFYEMREKLQLKLRRRKEAKIQKKSDDDQVPYLLDQRGLDDLVRYINGYEDSNWAKSAANTEKSSTTKTAKRKKQKQRKAKEKAKVDVQQCDNTYLMNDYPNGQCQIAQLCSNSDLLVKLKKKRVKHKVLYLQGEYSEDDDDDVRVELQNGHIEESVNGHHEKLEEKRSCLNGKCQSNISLTKLKPENCHVKRNVSENHQKHFSKQPQQQSQQQSQLQQHVLQPKEDLKLPSDHNLILNKCLSKKSKVSGKVSSNSKNGSKSQECISLSSVIPTQTLNNSNLEKSQCKTVLLNNVTQDTLSIKPVLDCATKKPRKSVEKVAVSNQTKSNAANVAKSVLKIHQGNHSPTAVLSNSSSSSSSASSTGLHTEQHRPSKEQQSKSCVEQKTPEDKLSKTKTVNKKLVENVLTNKITDQNKCNGKNKRNKKKNKSSDCSFVEDVFLPKSESDLENGEMDEVERELEEFKRFCLDSTSQKKGKLQVNMNIKDIFNKRKTVTCT